jgi:hypothetical protein
MPLTCIREKNLAATPTITMTSALPDLIITITGCAVT